MQEGGRRLPTSVRKAREETRRFAQNLLSENERLCAVAATLQREKQRLEEQLVLLQEELDRYQREQARLQRQLAEIEVENRHFAKEYVQVEQHHSSLANLYVVSDRLHSTLDRQELLMAIQEIITNLVGSEQVAIFELDSENSVLSLAASFGIEGEPYRKILLGTGAIGRAVLRGETYLRGQQGGNGGPPEEANLTACIPLKVDGKITGAIAVFQLLKQKSGLEVLDHELFNLLSTHAALALYCAGLHAKAAAGAGGTA